MPGAEGRCASFAERLLSRDPETLSHGCSPSWSDAQLRGQGTRFAGGPAALLGGLQSRYGGRERKTPSKPVNLLTTGDRAHSHCPSHRTRGSSEERADSGMEAPKQLISLLTSFIYLPNSPN